MTSASHDPNPAELERAANTTRAQVDRTLDALQSRLSLKRRMGQASTALSAAARGASRLASPPITTLIRLDHTHVLAAFRRYRVGSTDSRKRALVAHISLGLSVHAQLEEEIFYPALFAEDDPTGQLNKSVSEHDQMRALMQRLREMTPREAQYDETFFKLIRTVLHHVADEETTLLPLAETRLKDQLRELGWRMTRRRFELLRPNVAEAATTTVQTFPVLTGALVAGLVTAAWLVMRSSGARAARTPR